MGLDMYVYQVKNGEEIDWRNNKEMLYWRKANAIHDWFVDNIQGGEDDCKAYNLGPDKAMQLALLCQRIVKEPEKASDLLPTAEGFFFGSTDYDEWYHEQIAYTAEWLEKAVLTTNFDTHDLVYSSSW